jgi:hypothetical protein
MQRKRSAWITAQCLAERVRFCRTRLCIFMQIRAVLNHCHGSSLHHADGFKTLLGEIGRRSAAGSQVTQSGGSPESRKHWSSGSRLVVLNRAIYALVLGCDWVMRLRSSVP